MTTLRDPHQYSYSTVYNHVANPCTIFIFIIIYTVSNFDQGGRTLLFCALLRDCSFPSPPPPPLPLLALFSSQPNKTTIPHRFFSFLLLLLYYFSKIYSANHSAYIKSITHTTKEVYIQSCIYTSIYFITNGHRIDTPNERPCRLLVALSLAFGVVPPVLGALVILPVRPVLVATKPLELISPINSRRI